MADTSQRIVICGAGIAGIAAAYHLAVKHGCQHVTLVEAENPLSMTSDKSTESYRNWWPGPDPGQTAFMNHSIDLIEEIARATGNRINLNRRGYVFASADATSAGWLIEMATKAASHGAGPVRVHDGGDSYVPSPDRGFDTPLTGADIITDQALIRRHFPYLAPETRVIAHARRAGWLSAQQLGMFMLEASRERGVQIVRGKVTGVETTNGRLCGVSIDRAGAREILPASHLVLAAGPGMQSMAKTLGLDLPIYAEQHLKISLPDTLGIVPRTAPMLIWLDEQRLRWSDDERALLEADAATRWLTEPLPGGVHGRPDGAGPNGTLLMLFNYDNTPAEVVFPLPEHEHYGEITLRGMTRIVPGLQAYVDRGTRPYIDGGYYIRTQENRQLVGPTAIDGVFLSCAYSGFGIMAAPASGDLLARHLLGKPLPGYAPAFQLSRYQDPAYQALLADWGDGGQL
jgi:glycine/D-amino acid oxidase-like deaminating enzyme